MIRIVAALLLIVVVGTVGLPSSAEVRLLASEGDCAGCVWLQLDGPIDERSEGAMRKALTEFGFVNEVHLNSPGGNLQAALRLGQLFRDFGVRTLVAGYSPAKSASRNGLSAITPGDCFSACVYLLAGGTERLAVTGSKIGVHQFRAADQELVEDPLSLGQAQTGQLVAYLSAMGVDPLLVSYSSLVDAEDLALVDPQMAVESRLLSQRPIAVKRVAEMSANSVAKVSADPFGDAVRKPPTGRNECQKPMVGPEGIGSFGPESSVVANRFWRKMCNLYFDGPGTQDRWDIIYDAIQDLPPLEQIASSKESSVRTNLTILELRERQSRLGFPPGP